MITKETVLQKILLKINDELDAYNYRDVMSLSESYKNLEGDKI